MAHAEQHQFFSSIKEKYPDYFENKKVIDCGSLNVNGTLRDLFNDCKYIGIDIAPGRDVDIVSKTHEVDFPNETFDVVVSAEMLEHDEYWKDSLKKMYDLVKPGGLIAISCAGEGRPEHGTQRTGAIWGTSSDYYKNLTPEHIKEIYKEEMFSDWYFFENKNPNDTYFYGIKK